MITLLNHDNKEVPEETVVEWIKDAVCEYFHINRTTLGEDTNARMSSYPRKIFWYFGRCQYDIPSLMLQMIANYTYSASNVTIQSQTTLLQSQYNKEIKYDIEEIRKILTKKETLY